MYTIVLFLFCECHSVLRNHNAFGLLRNKSVRAKAALCRPKFAIRFFFWYGKKSLFPGGSGIDPFTRGSRVLNNNKFVVTEIWLCPKHLDGTSGHVRCCSTTRRWSARTVCNKLVPKNLYVFPKRMQRERVVVVVVFSGDVILRDYAYIRGLTIR